MCAAYIDNTNGYPWFFCSLFHQIKFCNQADLTVNGKCVKFTQPFTTIANTFNYYLKCQSMTSYAGVSHPLQNCRLYGSSSQFTVDADKSIEFIKQNR